VFVLMDMRLHFVVWPCEGRGLPIHDTPIVAILICKRHLRGLPSARRGAPSGCVWSNCPSPMEGNCEQFGNKVCNERMT
jgi:hypothetical protein